MKRELKGPSFSSRNDPSQRKPSLRLNYHIKEERFSFMSFSPETFKTLQRVFCLFHFFLHTFLKNWPSKLKSFLPGWFKRVGEMILCQEQKMLDRSLHFFENELTALQISTWMIFHALFLFISPLEFEIFPTRVQIKEFV